MQIPLSQFNDNQMHSVVDLNESSNATVASQLAASSSGTVGRGAPDLDPDPDLAGYPVFFEDPVGSGS